MIKEEWMDKKFFIKGFNQRADFPVLYDEEAYSWEGARAKAIEYFEKMGLLVKVMIFELIEGKEERVTRFIYKNRFGGLEEMNVWKMNNSKVIMK